VRRAVRERPRVFAAIGWLGLALLLVGALIGATAAGREGSGEREALVRAERAGQDAQARARSEGQRADELVRALEAEHGRVVQLTRELGSARRDAARHERASRRNRR